MLQYDNDKDGSIDYRDFQHYVRSKEKAIKRAFKALDEDSSGTISAVELVGFAQQQQCLAYLNCLSLSP